MEYERICREWMEWSGADFVFLWLCQREEGTSERIWHLVGFKIENDFAQKPNPVWYRSSEYSSVNEFCARSRETEFVDEVGKWDEMRGRKEFSVLRHPEMNGFAYRSFIVVPLVAAGEDDADEDEVIGTICLHFTAPFETRIDPERKDEVWAHHGAEIRPTGNRSTLNWLGRATAQQLVRSQQALQRSVLLELNRLAGQYLVASSKSPVTARKEYLAALGNTISTKFNIDCISLFYHDATYDSVFLLWTTGIVVTSPLGMGEANARLLPEERWRTITYGRREDGDSEGRTAERFFDGNALPLPDGLLVGQGTNLLPKTYEVRVKPDGTFDPKNFKDPALILPIPLPPSELMNDGEVPKDGKRKALGVLRFAGHRWHEGAPTNRSFDPVEIQTLQFLAEQIGPVLETMARNIAVEEALATQRHELRNSITMINNLVDDMAGDIVDPAKAPETKVRTYDLWDLKYSGLLARAQVQRLFRDDQEKKDLRVQLTTLYGEILARVCETVGRRALEEHKITVRLDHESCRYLKKVYVDTWYIEQAFLNLIMNAVKYGNPGTVVFVSAREDHTGTWITVVNEGIGVDPGDTERIFESGFRAKRAIARNVGAGLGLAITRIIMRKHGGDVTLEQAASPTRFALFFPASLRNPPAPQKS